MSKGFKKCLVYEKIILERMEGMPRTDIYFESLIEEVDYAKRIYLLKKIIKDMQ